MGEKALCDGWEALRWAAMYAPPEGLPTRCGARPPVARTHEDQTVEETDSSPLPGTEASGPRRAAPSPAHEEEMPPSSRTAALLGDTVPAAAPSGSAGLGLAITVDGEGDEDDPDTDADPVADPLIGLIIADRYRIVRILGRGGMGIVYEVEHTSIGKLLAMKLLAGELSAKKEVLRRFELEALTVSKLSSPYTVQVFDYGVWNHLTYLVMELVEGMDLARLLKRTGPMPFSRLGRLLVQVCSSLEEAHDKGIVHRDIKPENLMVIPDSRGVEMAKVCDFGLAKLRESPELNALTLRGAVVGTPYFISPEQIHGDDVDGRSDVYSIGAVLYRGLTGHFPFQARSPMAMFSKHLSEPPPSAHERFPGLQIPEGVSAAIQRCMAKEPEDRFASIAALRDVLLDELAALPLSSQERLLLDEPSSPGRKSSSEGREAPTKKARLEAVAAELAKSQLATREQLERYERKLRRSRYVTWGAIGLLGLGAAGALGLVGWRRYDDGVAGLEKEPNDDAASANPVTVGEEVSGFLGRRLDGSTGDRDLYRFTWPDDAALSMRLRALPNFPLCAHLYRVGYASPVGEFCTGFAGVDLEVEAFRMLKGDYLVAVSQDLVHRGRGEVRYVVENVSDAYSLLVAPAEASASELEPNDRTDASQPIAPGEERRGAIGWMGDEDVFCVGPGAGPLRWEVTDERRPEGTVLELVPTVGSSPMPLVRVHQTERGPSPATLPADVASPWTSPVIPATDEARCITLRITHDPWAADRPPRPSPQHYVVRVLDGG